MTCKTGFVFAIALLVSVLALANDEKTTEPFHISARLETSPVVEADQLTLVVRVSSTRDTHQFRFGGEPQVFGIYVLGPWGPVQPDLEKVRPENWMHQQHSASRRVTITSDQPFELRLKLADYFATDDAATFRPGPYQVNVKFYVADLDMAHPIDSGPVTFEIPAGEPEAR